MQTPIEEHRPMWYFSSSLGLVLFCAALVGCSPEDHRNRADRAAYRHIEEAQRTALGHTEPFTIEKPSDTIRRRLIASQLLPTVGADSAGADALPRIPHWPEDGFPARSTDADPLSVQVTSEAFRVSLLDALQIAARNSIEYQSAKERVFEAALGLEIESDAFRNSYTGLIESLISHDRTGEDPTTNADHGLTLGVTRRLKSGANLVGSIGLDLANLLSSDGGSSVGLVADASVEVPLLAGSGKHIVTEPLTQAQRNVVYALWEFERFKRAFAVQVVAGYLGVLQAADQLENARSNYESQVRSLRQSSALYQEDRLSKIELDQVRQAELGARNGWIAAQQQYSNTLGDFQRSIGLPFDSLVEFDPSELEKLAIAYTSLGAGEGIDSNPEEVPDMDSPIVLRQPSRDGAGPLELEAVTAVEVAFDQRLDLRADRARVVDAQRRVVVAADALKAGLTLKGTARAGGAEDLDLNLDRGSYSVGAKLDLPWERTSEGIAYRRAHIALDVAVREVQSREDQIKSELHRGLRRLVQAREGYNIGRVAVALAEQRVDQTLLERELGRPGVQVRDVLEAQADLLEAQNNLSAALVDYRTAELELQRDMDVLRVNEKGLIDEYEPNDAGQ